LVNILNVIVINQCQSTHSGGQIAADAFILIRFRLALQSVLRIDGKAGPCRPHSEPYQAALDDPDAHSRGKFLPAYGS
jgi:hypothetical protein